MVRGSKFGARFLAFSFLAVCVSGTSAKIAATAPVAERVILNAPVVAIDPKTHHLDLTLTKVHARIYNPGSGSFDTVLLRTYVAHTLVAERAPAGFVDSTPSPFIAPTIEAKPGDTIKISLHDALDPQPGCEKSVPNINIPHCFNSTNLHTHGLWVSPESPSDNVLLTLLPGKTEEYVYTVPADHPGGTLWYHPHNHGSTALQVGGGAAGALIIRGTRKPSAAGHGDIDTLLAHADVKERVLVMQQIQYACFDGQVGPPPDEDLSNYYATIKTTKPDGFWRCDDKDIGGIKGYAQLGFDGTVKGEKWSVSGRFTTINGETLPIFEGAAVGRLERWRIIDAGLANTISLVFRRLVDGAPSPDKLNVKQNADWVEKYCKGEYVDQFSMAADGITRGAIVDRGNGKQSIFQPGYREDLLLAFPRAGHYCVIDAAAEARESATRVAERAQLLGIVDAGGTGTVQQASFLRQKLTAALDQAGYDKPTADAVRGDLNDPAGIKLTLFTPHASLLAADPATLGHQEVAFNIGARGFMIGNKISDPNSQRPYNPSEWRLLKLGATDEWRLTSFAGGHPFHIHVNPFQIVAILDLKGKDVSVTGEPDSTGGDMQYADLKGTWKDTIFVKNGYTVVMRTKYERFAGRFVLHCHILDHEDQGMMENIEIVAPGHKPLSAGAPNAMGGMHMMP